jgi:putative CRISPR-associated protein (TIGR02619 family)
MAQPRPILLSTVGTSLFYPNLAGLKDKLAAGALGDDLRPLAEAYRDRRWDEVAHLLAQREPSERLCGAEVNSIASLVKNNYVPPDAGLYFFHSASDDGRAIADVLTRLHRRRGHSPVEAVEVEDLQDQDPRRFRTHGLRNLARQLCRRIREHSAEACAINATGGYKAQVAIAVLLGQALGIPVYYMHERFSDIIAFPPLPVALDFEVWMRASGLLHALEQHDEPAERSLFEDEWDERYESLVETVTIDGRDYLELSAAGQIFHETFRARFRNRREQVLPPPATAGQKRPPILKSDEGHLLRHGDEIERYLARLTSDVPQVVGCVTRYFNPDLPERKRFKLTRGDVEGIWSDGTVTVKFLVLTTATTEGQKVAVVAALNEWLAN